MGGGVRNRAASNGCFAGKRSWIQTSRVGITWVDPVTTIAKAAGFQHPYVEGVRVDLRRKKMFTEPCNDRIRTRPRGTGTFSLHSAEDYRRTAAWFGEDFRNFTFVSMNYSWKVEDAFVAADAPKYGWRLVGRARNSGAGAITSGPQVSNLFQKPGSLECIVTFKHTESTPDWLSNLDARPVNFGCPVSKVHAGFRDHMLRMVRDPSWQENVRSKLSSCSSVIVAGNSLGGASAALFSGCANSGRVGDRDYETITWRKAATPVMLPD